jgi:hypothetical protein
MKSCIHLCPTNKIATAVIVDEATTFNTVPKLGQAHDFPIVRNILPHLPRKKLLFVLGKLASVELVGNLVQLHINSSQGSYHTSFLVGSKLTHALIKALF